MADLVFSLNATMPIFFLILLGYVLRRRCRFMTPEFTQTLNYYVLNLALPVQLFGDLYETDFADRWDTGVVAYCFLATLASIILLLGLSLFLRDRSLRAEFVQGGYRGSQALLGAALMENIYGHTGPLALVLIGAVPLYNVAAVSVLTLLAPGGRLDRRAVGRTAVGIVTNPIILGIAAGMVWSLLSMPTPQILQRTVSSVGASATPMGLLALGASIDWKEALRCWRPTAVCSAMKLIVLPLLFLPVAIWLGWRGETLAAMLVMLASPTATSSFSMARSLGHPGVLTASVVVVTAAANAVTFTAWLYILRAFALI